MTTDVQSHAVLIEQITETLVKVYEPLAIYIFGSYSWGKPDKKSDLDIAVIIKHSDLDMASRMKNGFLKLRMT